MTTLAQRGSAASATLPTRHDSALAVDQTVMRIEALLFTPHGDDAFFDLHPLPMAEFLAGMSVCGEPGRFLDLGCGVGTKLAVAHFLGWQVTGVERHADYAEVAKRLVPEAEIIIADASGVDLMPYDVVYSYRLCVALDDQLALNRSIVSRMQPGSLFFCAGSDAVGEPLGHNVWRA